jgi:hypothetical protein
MKLDDGLSVRDALEALLISVAWLVIPVVYGVIKWLGF